jgi:omega-6 fatty acid desaturase (delta-12 desaturase)
MVTKETPSALPNMQQLRPLIAPYQKSQTTTALLQLSSTLVMYAGLWVLMVYSLKIGYWLTLLLSVLAAGMLVRLFIIFHDCGHGSFLPGRKANQIVGFFTGVLVFTASEHWWHTHAIHHANNGNLDRRGVGDVETLTVKEYLALSPLRRLGYRLFRHPLVMFIIGPISMFVIQHRLPLPWIGKKEGLSLLLHNLVLAGAIWGMSAWIGLRAFVLIQLPVIWLAGMFGIWLFYVQHQFENVYWARSAEWNYLTAALRGASYYELPGIFRWFSGNIGFHHLHHLSPRIPNYNLKAAHQATTILTPVTQRITLRGSLDSLGRALWDEEKQRLIRFNELG